MKDPYPYKAYIDLLNGEYKEVFERMEIYVLSSGERDETIQIIMSEILDIFISSQNDQKDISTIIGHDYKIFCDQMIQANKLSMFKRVVRTLEEKKYWIIYLLVMIGLQIIVNYRYITFTLKDAMNILMIVVFFLFLFLFIVLLRKTSQKLIFKYQWYTKKLDTVLRSVFAILLSILYNVVFVKKDVYSYIPYYIFYIVATVFINLRIKQDRKDKLK